MCTKLSQGPNGFRSNKGPLRTGPGNGQCVQATQDSITHMDSCRECLRYDTTFWDDTHRFCGNAYGGDNGQMGDIVAFDYRSGRSYSCDNPAVITDPNPPGGLC